LVKSSTSKLTQRLAALTEAVQAGEGRCDPAVIAKAKAVADRAGERVALGGDYTVVALAGSTGSGKSSLFNALTGTELAQVAARRPTTSKAMAVGWGKELPNELLDWLDVGKRHLLASDDKRLANMVLLDLPDHDSTEDAHRVTVERMVQLVDAVVWVVDPQKYADAALHDGYLQPLVDHADVMMMVLNQVDRLTPEGVKGCVDDLRRLLDSEGLRSMPLMATSATRKDGVYELRSSLIATVDRKQTMLKRLSLDVKKSAKSLAEDIGPKMPAKMNSSLKEQVALTMADAAGVPVVVEAVRGSWLRRGRAITGWPLLSWVSRLRPDPLQTLRAGAEAAERSVADSRADDSNATDYDGDAGSAVEQSASDHVETEDSAGLPRLPWANAVQKARVEQGTRELVDQAAQGLPNGWADAVRRASQVNDQRLADDLDAAIADSTLMVKLRAWWWVLIAVIQWVLIVGAVLGVTWWLAGPTLAASGAGIPLFVWFGLPAGVWVAAGGVVGGLLLTAVSRGLVTAAANRAVRRTETKLQATVTEIVAERVFAPVQAELDRYHQARAAAHAALR
jgi:GTPase Era involved in 16S rRNA processing